MTDISVAFQFYELATDELVSHDEWAACNGLNMWYLFILTILSIVVYRIISGYLIFIYTNKSFTRLASQILDIELLRSLYINYLCGKTEPCNPQRWITSLEAALESTPQALIQLVFLVKTNSFNPQNLLVLISLASSLWSITSKLIADDKTIIEDDAKSLNLQYKCRVFIDVLIGICTIILNVLAFVFCCCCAVCGLVVYIVQYEDAKKSRNKVFSLDENAYDEFWKGKKAIHDIDDAIKIFMVEQWKSTRSCSWTYLFRIMWRILDVSSRLFIMILTWLVIGGWALAIIILVEFTLILFICIMTKHWELIVWLVATVISMTRDIETITTVMVTYRTITNQILMILITVWMFFPFECAKCTPYSDRKLYVHSDSSVFGIWVFCWVSVFLSPMFLTLLFVAEMFIPSSTTSRQLQQMIDQNNNDGILELQLYAQEYILYDQQNNKKLLELALHEHKRIIVAYLLKKQNNDILVKDVLDWYPKVVQSKDLVNIFKTDPSIVNKNKKNAFWCAITEEDSDAISALIRHDKSLISSVDSSGRNFLHHYSINPLLLETKDLKYIEQQEPELALQLFFSAIAAKNEEYVNEKMDKMQMDRSKYVRIFKDSKGQGSYHYVAQGDFLYFDTFFGNINKREFKYEHDMDENGILYYLGTRCDYESYTNPSYVGSVTVTDSTYSNQEMLNNVVGRTICKYQQWGSRQDVPYLIVNLPISIKLTHYTLRNYKATEKSPNTSMKNWELQGSNNMTKWQIISKHEDESSLEEKGIYTWEVNPKLYFNKFRIVVNSSNSYDKWFLSVSNVEFYGVAIGFDPITFYEKYPQMSQHNGKTPFFASCEVSDWNNIDKLIEKYPQLLDTKSGNGENILDYFVKQPNLFNATILPNIYQYRPELVTKDGKNALDLDIDEQDSKQEEKVSNQLTNQKLEFAKWEKGLEYNTGREYWYNKETGKSTWEPPPIVIQNTVRQQRLDKM
eukprot:523273_1